MGYVGNQSTNAYSSLPAKQDLTGATGTSLTLSQAVAGPESIDLFINNVRQEPTTAYSVSDTTVTLTGSVVASDDIYVVYNGLALQTIVPPDGSVTSAKIADDAVTSAKLDTNIEVSGILTEPNKEYFQVALTTATTGHADSASIVVDFGGNGTVKYDTKSNFDSSLDAYQFDSSDGVYLVSFSVGLRSDAVGVEDIVEAGARVQFSTDNFSNTITDHEFGSAARIMDNQDDPVGSITLQGQTIFKNTSSSMKIRVQGRVNTLGSGTYEIEADTDGMLSTTFGASTRCTYLSVVRIA